MLGQFRRQIRIQRTKIRKDILVTKEVQTTVRIQYTGFPVLERLIPSPAHGSGWKLRTWKRIEVSGSPTDLIHAEFFRPATYGPFSNLRPAVTNFDSGSGELPKDIGGHWGKQDV